MQKSIFSEKHYSVFSCLVFYVMHVKTEDRRKRKKNQYLLCFIYCLRWFMSVVGYSLICHAAISPVSWTLFHRRPHLTNKTATEPFFCYIFLCKTRAFRIAFNGQQNNLFQSSYQCSPASANYFCSVRIAFNVTLFHFFWTHSILLRYKPFSELFTVLLHLEQQNIKNVDSKRFDIFTHFIHIHIPYRM